jgi:hypothetical protein
MYSIFIKMPLTHTTVSAASADLLNSMLNDGRLVRTKHTVKNNILYVPNKVSKFQEPDLMALRVHLLQFTQLPMCFIGRNPTLWST